MVTLLTSGEMFQANFLDVSKSGLRVRVMAPLEAGQTLRIRFGTVIAFGEVRWRRSAEGSHFHLGIEVDHTLMRELVDRMHEALSRVKRGA